MTAPEIEEVIARARLMRQRAIFMQNYNAEIQARLLEQSERLARLQGQYPRPVYRPPGGDASAASRSAA